MVQLSQSMTRFPNKILKINVHLTRSFSYKSSFHTDSKLFDKISPNKRQFMKHFLGNESQVVSNNWMLLSNLPTYDTGWFMMVISCLNKLTANCAI